MWSPEETELGPVTQLENFSFNITYTSPLEGPATVTVVALDEIPPSVAVSGNNISGVHGMIFDDTLVVMDENLNYDTIRTLDPPIGSVFEKVNEDNVYEVIAYLAARIRVKTYNYLAIAEDPELGSVSKHYTLTVDDRNWTPGQQSLIQLVNKTRKV